jgi:hypothetical protein
MDINVNDLWYLIIAFWAIVSAWAVIEGLK